eukprot:275159_1
MPEIIGDLFKFNNKDIIAISNRIDLIILWMKHSSTIRFKHVSKCCHFTLTQLNELSNHLPKLWQNNDFLCLYLEKLMPSQISFYLSKTSSDMIDFIPLELATKCFEIAVKFVLTHSKCEFAPLKKANILINYLQFKQKNKNDYDLEILIEYLKIEKRTEYNSETKTNVISTNVTDNILELINDKIELFCGKWRMIYDNNKDYNVVNTYISHFISKNDQPLVHNIDIRFNSKWFKKWININKEKNIEQCLSDFVDERYLKILKLQNKLYFDENDRKTIEYMTELKELIENGAKSKPKYCSHDIINDLENKIMFDFDRTKTKKK